MNISEAARQETRWHLVLANDFGYGETGTLMPLFEDVSRLLNESTRPSFYPFPEAFLTIKASGFWLLLLLQSRT